MGATPNKVCAIHVDHETIRLNSAVEREQCVAIDDLLEENTFELVGRHVGPYQLTLSTRGARLSLHVATANGDHIVSHILSLTPLRRVIQDYATICETHTRAVSLGDPYRAEMIDMGRRAVHDQGSHLLMARLSERIIVDKETARRLFTLIAAPYVTLAFQSD